MQQAFFAATLALLFIQCNNNDANTANTEQQAETPRTLFEPTPTTDEERVAELQDSIELYFERHSHCTILDKEPLRIKVSKDDTEPAILCNKAETQLEMNFCAAAQVCVEIENMQNLLQRIRFDNNENRYLFLQGLWVYLNRVEIVANQSGRAYEGGSMQRMVVLNRKSELLAQKNTEYAALILE
jgi:hypothetical protein